MTPDVAEELQKIVLDLAPHEKNSFDSIVQPVVTAAWRTGRHWDFSAPAKIVDKAIASAIQLESEEDKHRLRRAFVAKCCLSQVGKFTQKLPDSVTSLYPKFYARIAKYLKYSETYTYDDFSKDVRYSLNMTLPAGLLEIDLESRVGPKLVLRKLKSLADSSTAISYLRYRSWGNWYNDHLDLRGDLNFSPGGWTDCFQRIAEAINMNKHIRGVQGVGWFYDPALTQVSPHLAYIRETQVRNGAFLIKIGPGEEHTRRAIMKSNTRRKLVQEGKYLPTCYALLWPRKALLAWAKEVKRHPCLGFSQ